jgi:hypothetical protein
MFTEWQEVNTEIKSIMEKIQKSHLQVARKQSALDEQTMYVFNNVWWAFAELPWKFLKETLPWLRLTSDGISELRNQVLALNASRSKTQKIQGLASFLNIFSCGDCGMGYVARSDDILLYDKFVQQGYQGKWSRIPHKVLSDSLYEAIRLTQPKMTDFLLKNTLGLNIDWQASECSDPRRAFLDVENYGFLEHTVAAERVRKRLDIQKREIPLISYYDLPVKVIRYILDDQEMHPQLKEAIVQWIQKKKDSTKKKIALERRQRYRSSRI